MRKTSKLLLCVTLSLSLLFCSGCLPLSPRTDIPSASGPLLSSDAHDYNGSYKTPIPLGKEFEIEDSKLTYTLKVDQLIRGNKAKNYVDTSDWEEPGSREYIAVVFTMSVKELNYQTLEAPVSVKGYEKGSGNFWDNLYDDSETYGKLTNISDIKISSPGTFQAFALFYVPSNAITHLMVHHEQSGRYYYFAVK